MSMTVLTLLQFISVFCAYTFMVVILPALVFRPLLHKRRIPEQFLLCLLIGNFFVMNLVFVLQLLHISGTVTLCLGTFVTAAVAGVKINKIDVKTLFNNTIKKLKKVTSKNIGKKTLLYQTKCSMVSGMKRFAKGFYRLVVKKAGQWLWVLLILGALVVVYAPQFLNNYGYIVSDIPVHLYWINSMKENDIFVAGVYPFGYHCVIYFINEVFAIDVYVVMRVIAFVQNIYITLALLAFLKLCCRNKYIPYAATFLYVACDFYNQYSYYRLLGPLPQEFGMMFIFPAIYFGFRFFEQRRNELKAGEKKKKESLLCLIGFAMSFAMTLSAHFYGTMIAGLFCVGLAVGYFGLFIRKRYFWNIVVTCVISVMIAVLPMAIAFATGTGLEGSLRWGLSVMSGAGDGEEEETTTAKQEKDKAVPVGDVMEEESEDSEIGGMEHSLRIVKRAASVFGTASAGSVTGKLKDVCQSTGDSIGTYVFYGKYSGMYRYVFGAIVLVSVLGIGFQLSGRYCYGSMLLSCGVYMILMCALQNAQALGLPSLMDAGRCSIYFAYSTPVLFAFCADGVLNIFFWKEEYELVKNATALVAAAGFCLVLNHYGMIKDTLQKDTLQTNEAVACLTNIIREEKDFTWTIVSANDETHMGKEHGYHYEIIDFLRRMETVAEGGTMILPTDVVYFFIEKRPIDYTEPYENSGQRVSKNGAMNMLPISNGTKMYWGEKRWIVMSRMYYWALEFQRMYPNEMTIYCETDKFICYRIEQNPYRLYNFAIDYVYNTR